MRTTDKVKSGINCEKVFCRKLAIILTEFIGLKNVAQEALWTYDESWLETSQI